MSFFRRRRKEKTAAPVPAAPVEEAEPAPDPAEAPPAEAAPLAEAAPPVAPMIEVVEPPPASPPPPLPERVAPPADPLPIAPRPLSQCFVCGTPLEGGLCPKCQMRWVE